MREQASDLQDFLYSVSHDFGRPLRQISAFTDLLKDKHGADFDSETSAWLDYLEQAGQEANVMLERLLVYSRLLAYKPNPQHQEIAPLVSEVLAKLSTAYPQRVKDITVSCDAAATVDAELLKSTLFELLHNALSYSRPGPVEVKISVEADRGSGTLVCLVHDSGPGIEDDKQDAALRPFGRLAAQDSGHVGMGLNIATRAVEKAKGELTLRTGPQRFTVEVALPV